MKFNQFVMALVGTVLAFTPAWAQKFSRAGRLYLGNDSTHCFKFTLVNQLWLRGTHTNPGTQVYGYDKSQITDANVQHSQYDRLNGAGNFYDLGLNWLLAGHNSKLTLAYQSRPIYTSTAQVPTEYRRSGNRGATILQYQVFFI